MTSRLLETNTMHPSEPMFKLKTSADYGQQNFTSSDYTQNATHQHSNLSGDSREKSIRKMWEKEKKPWNSSFGGRLAIRSVSRGILGAAFYAWGTQKVRKDMPGYKFSSKNPELSLKPENMVQHIARFFDLAAGKPIQKTFGLILKDKNGLSGKERAERIVTFRPTLGDNERTLGEDAVYNTFDFAAASAGDALGREIIGLFDPAMAHKWRDEKGQINFPSTVKRLIGAVGRIILAPMEDWFVAVPYTFQQKVQRKLINKFSPGFENTADGTLHGSAYKLEAVVDEERTAAHKNTDGLIVYQRNYQGTSKEQVEKDEQRLNNSDIGMKNREGRIKYKIKGTYAWEGFIDLQLRFTGYNFGTGLFRDIVEVVQKNVDKFRHPDRKDLHEHEHKTPQTMFRASKDTFRGFCQFLANRIIKTFVIMTPSIPIFSIMRIPQNRHKAIGWLPVQAIDKNDKPVLENGHHKTVYKEHKLEQIDTVTRNRKEWNKPSRILDHALDPFGRIANNLANRLGALGEASTKNKDKKNDRKELFEIYANATLAYTPYIFAKNEFAKKWDNEELETAVNRTVDGMFNWKFSEITKGFRDIKDVVFMSRKQKERQGNTIPSPVHTASKSQPDMHSQASSGNPIVMDIIKQGGKSPRNWQEYSPKPERFKQDYSPKAWKDKTSVTEETREPALSK